MGQQLTFSRTAFDQHRNNGLGEWTACFGTSEGIAKSFASAAARPGLSTMGGVVPLTLTQINQRIDQLSALEGKGDVIAQLERGRHAIEEKTHPKAQVAHVAKMTA